MMRVMSPHIVRDPVFLYTIINVKIHNFQKALNDLTNVIKVHCSVLQLFLSNLAL